MHAMSNRIVFLVVAAAIAGGGCVAGADPGDISDVAAPEAFSGTCDPARARDAVSPFQRAMLDTIATTEGTFHVSDDGYNEYFTGALFNDCTQHPAVQHCAGSLCSDAAGRYQFLSTTWRGLGLPNFFPDDQDIGAVRLITGKRTVSLPTDRALSRAEFEAAMGTCNTSTGHGLALEWASLPPGCYGQPSRTMDQAWSIYSGKVAGLKTGGGGTVVELKANNGNFVSSQGGTTGTAMNVYANRTAVGPWEKFRLVPVSGGYAIACQGAAATTFYVTAENGGGGAVHCNRTAVGPWETFQLEWRSAWQLAFKTANGHFLSAQNGGGSGVDATRTAVGIWETFAAAEGLASGSCSDAEFAAQDVQGTSFWTCQGNSRYVCDGQRHKVIEDCASGCTASGAGADDQCNAASLPQCTAAEYAAQNLNGTSFWTCQGNSRYLCDGQNDKITQLCNASCVASGSGIDDQCR